MKKLLKKLKKNQLLSKISACLMILVILVSSLGVSTFAADETEAEAEYVIPAGTYTWVESPSAVDAFILIVSGFSNGYSFSGFSFGIMPGFYSNAVFYFETEDLGLHVYSIIPSDSAFAPDPYFYGWLDDAYRTFTLNDDVTTDEATYTAFMANIEKPILHTDSVLDVFTGITGAIMDSLGSAQNVFFTSEASVSGSFVLPDRSLDGDRWIYSPVDIDFVPSDGSFVLFEFNGVDFSFTLSSHESLPGLVGITEVGSTTMGVQYYNDTWSVFSTSTSNFSGSSVSYSVSPFISLTLLGTLAVIGVGLALCFLFIGLISKFLRNRG